MARKDGRIRAAGVSECVRGNALSLKPRRSTTCAGGETRRCQSYKKALLLELKWLELSFWEQWKRNVSSPSIEMLHDLNTMSFIRF